MPDPGSPFHAGEQLVQSRQGVRELAERIGRKMIRAEMPDQHREFFARLPYVVLGGVDAAGRPWATMLAGRTGFLDTPDARTLRISALPRGQDPLAAALGVGAPVAVLGIELATRRRNRANGTIVARDAAGFTVGVEQSFGNCPQHITPRTPETETETETETVIRSADTFFIASASDGVDVSHRGGPPGFVHVDGDTLTWPDYSGNNMFNTLGNLVRAPRAGLVFPDFTTGGLRSLTGTTTIVWEPERMIRFRIDAALHLPRRLPARWTR
jgi:predicted pyridoxine 5'-phosphate oxidase superfamily flavin-nucleotide-binding protein